MISTPIYQAIFQKKRNENENENESRCQNEKSLWKATLKSGVRWKLRKYTYKLKHTYICAGYKARVIKQWWCARIHIFKMDGWANEWIIWKYAPTSGMGRASHEEKRRDWDGTECCIYFARLLQSAPCQKVSDFGTWGMFVIIIISSGEAAHFSQCFLDWAGQYGGRRWKAEPVGVVLCLAARAGQDGTCPTDRQTFMKYGCQFFLRCSVLSPWVRGTFISFNFLEIFFSPTLRFPFEFFFSVYSPGGRARTVGGYWGFSVWCLCFFPLNAS